MVRNIIIVGLVLMLFLVGCSADLTPEEHAALEELSDEELQEIVESGDTALAGQAILAKKIGKSTGVRASHIQVKNAALGVLKKRGTTAPTKRGQVQGTCKGVLNEPISSFVPGEDRSTASPRQGCCRHDQCVKKNGQCVNFDQPIGQGYICGEENDWDRCEGNPKPNKYDGQESEGGNYVCVNGEWVDGEGYDNVEIPQIVLGHVFSQDGRRDISYISMADGSSTIQFDGNAQRSIGFSYLQRYTVYVSDEILVGGINSILEQDISVPGYDVELAEYEYEDLNVEGAWITSPESCYFQVGGEDLGRRVFVSFQRFGHLRGRIVPSNLLYATDDRVFNKQNEEEQMRYRRQDSINNVPVELLEITSTCPTRTLSYIPGEDRTLLPKRRGDCFSGVQCATLDEDRCVDAGTKAGNLICDTSGDWFTEIESYTPWEDRTFPADRVATCSDGCARITNSCRPLGYEGKVHACTDDRNWGVTLFSYQPGEDTSQPLPASRTTISDQHVCIDEQGVEVLLGEIRDNHVCGYFGFWQTCGAEYSNLVTRVDGDHSDNFEHICQNSEWVPAGEPPVMVIDYLLDTQQYDHVTNDEIEDAFELTRQRALLRWGVHLRLRNILRVHLPEEYAGDIPSDYWEDLYDSDTGTPDVQVILGFANGNQGLATKKRLENHCGNYANGFRGRSSLRTKKAILPTPVVSWGHSTQYTDERPRDHIARYWGVMGNTMHEIEHYFTYGVHTGNVARERDIETCAARLDELGWRHLPRNSWSVYGICPAVTQEIRKGYERCSPERAAIAGRAFFPLKEEIDFKDFIIDDSEWDIFESE